MCRWYWQSCWFVVSRVSSFLYRTLSLFLNITRYATHNHWRILDKEIAKYIPPPVNLKYHSAFMKKTTDRSLINCLFVCVLYSAYDAIGSELVLGSKIIAASVKPTVSLVDPVVTIYNNVKVFFFLFLFHYLLCTFLDRAFPLCYWQKIVYLWFVECFFFFIVEVQGPTFVCILGFPIVSIQLIMNSVSPSPSHQQTFYLLGIPMVVVGHVMDAVWRQKMVAELRVNAITWRTLLCLWVHINLR